MYKVILLIAVIALPNCVSFSQTKISLNPNFHNIWLRYDYYDNLLNNKTPCELKPGNQNIMYLYFYEDENRVLIGSFNEGYKKYFTVKNRDTINIDNSNYIIYLFSESNNIKLTLLEGEKKITFSALDEKYYTPNGVDKFINEKFFEGEYFCEFDPSIKIVFTSDGDVIGFKNFNKYKVPINSVGLPTSFDTVLLLEINKKIKNSILLHWQKSTDKIIFYNVSKSSEEDNNIGKYAESTITNEYLTLIKKK